MQDQIPGYGSILSRKGFAALAGAQFLGALNDNFLKMAAILLVTASAGTAADPVMSPAEFVALTSAVFILPFLLFSPIAGQIADRTRKDLVISRVKLFEIPAMLLAVPALLLGETWMLLGVIFLVATQSAFFSPAKYGILPEILRPAELSRGNAIIESSTFLAIILGAVLGGVLFDRFPPHVLGFIMVALAVIGWVISLFTARAPEPACRLPLNLNPANDLLPGFRFILSTRPMVMTVLGIAWFWLLAAFLQMAAIRVGREVLELDGGATGMLQAAIAIGIGAGSLAAGRLSGPGIEPGLVPLGSIAMGISALFFAGVTSSFPLSILALAALGFSGGLYIVPLNATLQQKSDGQQRGRVIAISNFIGTIGILLASLLAWTTGGVLGWSPDSEMLLVGLAIFAATVIAIVTVPDYLTRFILWALTHSFYRIRIRGHENIPYKGGALLVVNHVSFLDALFVGAGVQRHIRFMAFSGFFRGILGWFLRHMHAIPVGGTESLIAIKRARAELEAGHVVCIFAEGAISRTGNTLPFKRGIELITKGLEVPVIPVHLDQVYGSIFSFKGGRFFWKKPERLFRPITLSFGPWLKNTPERPIQAWQVRRAVLELGSHAWDSRPAAEDRIHTRFLRMAKKRSGQKALMDTSGTRLTYREAAIGSILLARRFRKLEPMVGIMLPASAGGALVNMGLMLSGKTPVNLNFTAGPEAMASAIRKCDIRTIITSRSFLEKAKLERPEGALFVEDLMKGFTKPQKAFAATLFHILPSFALARLLGGLSAEAPPATVMFSSGSSGEPKGVVLSHKAIISNLEAVAQILWIEREDCIAGVLPFFHSFGFTATLCLPLVAGIRAAYHPNPLDAKAIGPLVKKAQATILLGTPTFLANWTRAADPLEMISLRHVITGAERLRPEIADGFEQKFGLRPLEGYGMTEMGPIVATNAADIADRGQIQAGRKDGTVGRPIPGVAVKTIDLETGLETPDDVEGLLLVKGPGMMDGYLGDPSLTAKVVSGGWYSTGDIACIDQDGFIEITGRLSRFSKIAGEMIPHGVIEETAARIEGIDATCVVALPDPAKGEKIYLIYAGSIERDRAADELAATTLPRLWLPRRDAIIRVPVVPMLGSGKLDLQSARKMVTAA